MRFQFWAAAHNLVLLSHFKFDKIIYRCAELFKSETVEVSIINSDGFSSFIGTAMRNEQIFWRYNASDYFKRLTCAQS